MTDTRKIGPMAVRPQIKNGQPTGKYFVDIPASLANGKRKRLLYKSRTAAEGVARELKKMMELKKLGYTEAPPNRGALFRDAVAQWEDNLELDVKTGEFRSSMLRAYRTRLKALLAYFGGHMLDTVNVQAIKRYQGHRIDAGLKAVTINGELRVLRQFLGWCVEQGDLASLPKVPKLTEERRWLEIPTANEVMRLVDHLRPTVKVLVWLMAETGLRPDEALTLPWAHVNANEGKITIRAYGSWKPKTASSARTVYPSDELMEELRRLPRNGDYVFPGKDPSKPIQNVRTALATAVKQAGLTRNGQPMKVTVKLFRKAFATTLARRGANHSVVGALMGHAPRLEDDRSVLHVHHRSG